VRDIVPTRIEEIKPFLYWADREVLRFWLPASALSMQGAFSYGGWHPFLEGLRQGPDALARYYEGFRPVDLAEMYRLPKVGERGETQPPWELPWLHRKTRVGPSGEKGLGPEHGASFYGPATLAKARLEFQRLDQTRRSILAGGYRPERFGDISGQFLVDGTKIRFFVAGGKHRAAVLASLGWDRIPVVVKPHWPRGIYSSTVADWPLVQSGEVSEAFALRVFRSFFKPDGNQQVDRLRGAVGQILEATQTELAAARSVYAMSRPVGS